MEIKLNTRKYYRHVNTVTVDEKGHLRVANASRCDKEYMKLYKEFKEARNVMWSKLGEDVKKYGFIVE